MLLMWQNTGDTGQRSRQVHDAATLDTLLDQLHQQAAAARHPHATVIYAGNHYPRPAHARGDTPIPADPGDGPQPELTLVVGATDTPLYWDGPDGSQQVSVGPRLVTQPEPEYFFEFYYGGQESYATESSLIPATQARQAARLFLTNGGQQPDNITWRSG
jgi:Immunity protein Imm1